MVGALLCVAAMARVSTMLDANGRTVMRYDVVTLPLTMFPEELRAAANATILDANLLQFSTEAVLAQLRRGCLVVLVLGAPEDAAVQARMTQVLRHVVAHPDQQWRLALAFAPSAFWSRPSAYFWESTTAGRAWKRQHGDSVPPFVLVASGVGGGFSGTSVEDGGSLPFGTRAIGYSYSEMEAVLQRREDVVLTWARKLGYRELNPLTPTRMRHGGEAGVVVDGAGAAMQQHHEFYDEDAVEGDAWALEGCPTERLLWHVYPDDGVTGPLNMAYAEVMGYFRGHAQHTTDPAKACFFFVPFETTPMMHMQAYLRSGVQDYGDNAYPNAVYFRIHLCVFNAVCLA